MADEKWDYADALKTAQALGYAEPDPTNDVEGFDTAYKLAILASLAFHKRIDIEDIFIKGITNITADDVEIARELGYSIKLLAIGKRDGDAIEARVHATMIPLDHPLSTVSGPFNAVFAEGNAAGPLMFYGRGAGDYPTASAAVSDIINALTEDTHTRYGFALARNGKAKVAGDWETAFYIRTMAADRPGVLEKVAGVFARHGVSIESVVQRGRGTSAVPLVFVTHKTREKACMAAVEEIKSMDFLSVASIIRVEI
jgi:homoserine dehydrogenase